MQEKDSWAVSLDLLHCVPLVSFNVFPLTYSVLLSSWKFSVSAFITASFSYSRVSLSRYHWCLQQDSYLLWEAVLYTSGSSVPGLQTGRPVVFWEPDYIREGKLAVSGHYHLNSASCQISGNIRFLRSTNPILYCACEGSRLLHAP